MDLALQIINLKVYLAQRRKVANNTLCRKEWLKRRQSGDRTKGLSPRRWYVTCLTLRHARQIAVQAHGMACDQLLDRAQTVDQTKAQGADSPHRRA